MTYLPWILATLAITLWCGVQAVRDFRRKSYVMATIGAALTMAMFVLPGPPVSMTVAVPVR